MDIQFQNHGSICILKPTSPAGQAWIDQHFDNEEIQFWANGLVVEPRYVAAIIDGAAGDGIEVGS